MKNTLQNGWKRVWGAFKNTPGEMISTDIAAIDIAGLEALLRQSRELLVLTNEVKMQAADIVRKIGMEEHPVP